MALNPTKVTAIQIQPGFTAFVDPLVQLLGAVTVHDQIFVIAAEFDREPPPTPIPQVEAPAAQEAQTEGISPGTANDQEEKE